MPYVHSEVSDDQITAVSEIKAISEQFILQLDNHRPSREMSLARTKIEEAVMWAVKGITKEKTDG